MIIDKNDLPSRLIQCVVEPLSALAIMEAENKKDLLRAILASVNDEARSVITIQDLHFITLFQRLLVSDVSSLVVTGSCQYPIFLVDRNGEQVKTYSLIDVGDKDVIQGTIPCGGGLATHLTLLDMEVKYLSDIPEELVEPEFDLPRAADLEFYIEGDRKNWILLHLKREYRTPAFLADKGQEFLAKLVRYVNMSEHGIINTVAAICPDCGRRSDIKYTIDLSTFL